MYQILFNEVQLQSRLAMPSALSGRTERLFLYQPIREIINNQFDQCDSTCLLCPLRGLIPPLPGFWRSHYFRRTHQCQRNKIPGLLLHKPPLPVWCAAKSAGFLREPVNNGLRIFSIMAIIVSDSSQGLLVSNGRDELPHAA